MSEFINHDGSGCPVPKGTMVEVVLLNPPTGVIRYERGPALSSGRDESWTWAPFVVVDGVIYGVEPILAYRVVNDGDNRAVRLEMFRDIARRATKEVVAPEPAHFAGMGAS